MTSAEVPDLKITHAEDLRKQQEEHKQRVMPLVRFLRKHGLKFKHAGCLGGRVEYFRTDMLSQILEAKK